MGGLAVCSCMCIGCMLTGLEFAGDMLGCTPGAVVGYARGRAMGKAAGNGWKFGRGYEFCLYAI